MNKRENEIIQNSYWKCIKGDLIEKSYNMKKNYKLQKSQNAAELSKRLQMLKWGMKLFKK